MKFSGVKILQGVEISIFLLIFEWALQQCSATALPVITLEVAVIHAMNYLARLANLPEGLYILLALISAFLSFLL